MQVILIQDVKSLGKKGEVVNVSDGYARNYILPKKLGLEANAKNMNDLKLQKAAEEKQKAEILAAAQDQQALLTGKSITVSIKAGEGGKTFGSISSKEIAEEMKKQIDFEVDKKKLVLSDAIKQAGEYTVAIKLHPQVTGEIKVIVKTV